MTNTPPNQGLASQAPMREEKEQGERRVKDGYTLSQIAACHYCEHFNSLHAGPRFEIDACADEKNPYVKKNEQGEAQPTHLNTEQVFRGCPQFLFEKNKMKLLTATTYGRIPKDSPLRSVPPDNLVGGYRSDMDLQSHFTLDEWIDANDKRSEAHWKNYELIKDQYPSTKEGYRQMHEAMLAFLRNYDQEHKLQEMYGTIL